MATKKFLDADGLLYLWGKIKAAISAAVPTKTSQLTNDSGFLTKHQTLPDASTSKKGMVQLSSATNSTSNALAATAGAVKAAYDLAAGKANPGDIPTATSQLTNDSGFLTSHQTLPTASTGAAGIVKLSSATNSSSETTAATAKAVKTAYDLAAGKASKATTLSGYGITNAYTKSEIDAKLTSAMRYKGTVESSTDLPTNAATGDMYNVTNAGGTDASGVKIKAGDNVVWNGTGWDNQGGSVDLSAYITNSDVITNTEIDTITAS